MQVKNMRLKISTLYFFLFGTAASYYPFLAIYLQDRELSYTQIGILFAINSLIGVVSQPIWGVITDKYLNKRVTLTMILLVSGVLSLGFIFVNSFYAILVTLVIFMAVQSPMFSVNDALCYDIVESHSGLQYGKIRLMGSIGFALMSLGLGAVINKMGINSAFYTFFIFAMVSFVILRTIKYNGVSSGSSINLGDIFGIMKNNRFIIITISAMFIAASQGANGNYLAILIQETGGDVSNLGMLWFIIAMSELPIFFFGGRIMKKFGVLNVYFFCLAAYTLRFLGDSIASSYQMVLILQILQGITYPLFLMSTLDYISGIVSEETRTTAMTAFTAFTGGIGGFIGNFGGGLVIQNFSVFILFRVAGIFSIIALAVGLFLRGVDKRHHIAS